VTAYRSPDRRRRERARGAEIGGLRRGDRCLIQRAVDAPWEPAEYINKATDMGRSWHVVKLLDKPRYVDDFGFEVAVDHPKAFRLDTALVPTCRLKRPPEPTS
jgi:hypothetical protein